MSIAILSKIFSDHNTIDLGASLSGLARIGSIMTSLTSILQHPFGIGYDNYYKLLNTEATGYVAAEIMTTGAVLGIVPLVVIVYWLFKPIFKASIGRLGKVLFVFLYFNTALAQSSQFYPALICIPLFFYYYYQQTQYRSLKL